VAASAPSSVEWLIENPRDGSLLVLVPPVESMAGGGDEGIPGPFKIKLPAYYLAIHPVTNAQYARFLNECTKRPPELKRWILIEKQGPIVESAGKFDAPPRHADEPVTRVSWNGAEAYAEWAELRLPTELEWEKGARGSDGRQYPWGNAWHPQRLRHAENIGRETTANVWSYAEGASPFGMYQMSGNVWEWCGDWFSPTAYDHYWKGELAPPAQGESKVIRGGSWKDSEPAVFRATMRESFTPDYCDVKVGFRLAKSLS
jgi:serine/threonine-protein kinase